MTIFDEGRFFQQAFLVNDIEAACHQWNQLYGAGPFTITPHHVADTFTYRGTSQEADVTYAFGYLGDMMIQFIEQHDETPSIYRDMYAAGQEGFHHVGILVHDYEAAKRHFVDRGFEVACELHHDDVDACYLDTRSVNGGFTELHTDPPRIIAAFGMWHRAHVLWRPGDPVTTVRGPRTRPR